jgi:hypothetical protein
MPKHRPTSRLGVYTPQWLGLLIEMRLITPKQASDAHRRAVKQTGEESNDRRRRRKPDP